MKRLVLLPFRTPLALTHWLAARRARLAGCALAATLCLTSVSAWGQATWTGSNDDRWFNALNWDTNSIPNGVTVDVLVGAPSPTIVDGNVNINSLVLTADGSITVNSGLNFDFGGTAATTLNNAGAIQTLNNTDFQLARGVINSGSIQVNAGASFTDLEVIGAGATLSGGGVVSLSGVNARIMGLAGANLNIENQVIQGFGQLGANSLGISNQANGLIQANEVGERLIIDPSNSGNFTNQGVLRASGGGILQLTGSGGGVFNNTGGVIQAGTGSVVELTVGASVSGGSLSSTGTGLFRVNPSTNVFLTDLNHSGNFIVENNSDLGISGTIDNAGEITVSSGASFTDIEVQAGGANLTGGGTITLQGANARIEGVVGSPTLTITDQTIQGQGNLGNNNLGIINGTNGLVQANTSGQTLTIDPSNAGNLINQGTLRAVDGGILVLDGLGDGTFNNTDGRIEALDGSEVQLTRGANITGGVLNSAGTGLFRVNPSADVFLTDLTHSGQLVVDNNSDLGFSGTINNTGSITVNSGANFTDVEIQSGGATLTGGGSITLQGGNARIEGVVGSPMLTITDQTIQGRGNLGNNNLGIINGINGLVQANNSGQTLTIDPSNAGNLINQGTLRAVDGGILVLDGLGGGTFNNIDGRIEALDGSEVQLTRGANITGGVLNSAGTGVFRVNSSTDAFLTDLTHSGQLIVENNSELGFSGTIGNTGAITVNSGASFTGVDIQSSGANLTGGGTITLQGDNARIEGVVGSPTLTITDQTIQGRGSLGNNSLAIVNGANGVIQANSAGNILTIDPSNAGNFVNAGTIRAVGGGELLLTGSGGGSFSGGGVYEALDGGLLRANSNAVISSLAGGVLTEGTWRAIDDGLGSQIWLQNNATSLVQSIGANAAVELSGANSSFTVQTTNARSLDSTLNQLQGGLTLRNGRVMNLNGRMDHDGALLLDGETTALFVNGDFTQSGGTTYLVNGATLDLTAGASNELAGGLIGGTGTIVGDLSNSQGQVAPGLSAGVLSIDGNYTQGALGSLWIEIGGTVPGISFDQLNITGEASLDGTLMVSLLGGYTPNATDSFEILTAGMLSGVFSNAPLQVEIQGGGYFDVTYTGGSVILGNFNAVPEPAAGLLLAVAAGIMAGARRRRS